MARVTGPVPRLAIVVSHPIQYYVPLYQRLAKRDDLAIKVFFTWHAAAAPVRDRGFGTAVEWDIPLASGYEHQLVPNKAGDPGTHRFMGLRNPSLLKCVAAWSPDLVHVTGWAWWSHLRLLRQLHSAQTPSLFRGDSHLLGARRRGLEWEVKRRVLKRVFSWPSKFLYVGSENRDYYRAFGVDEERLRYCPHSIDVGRFATGAERFEREAAEWRNQLEISETATVVLFAGKFEPTKQPLMLMDSFLRHADRDLVLLMVGSGVQDAELRRIAANEPGRIRILPFQNQSRMPVVYRLGDVFILPSAGETWGLAVNEALACGRPVLVSDRVGCARDVVDKTCGEVFPWSHADTMMGMLNGLNADRSRLPELSRGAMRRAWSFDVERTEDSLVDVVRELAPQ